MQRRSFLGGILAACAAPAFVRAGVLMPIKQPIWVPPTITENFVDTVVNWKNNISGLRIYSGSQPFKFTDEPTGTLLAVVPTGTKFDDIVGSAWGAPLPLEGQGTVLRDGRAGWFELTDERGKPQMRGSCGMGGDLVMYENLAAGSVLSLSGSISGRSR